MKYSIGNTKLGKSVIVVSRPVGLSCPQNCHFLGNGCYAEHTEKQYKATRPFAMPNMAVSTSEIVELIKLAKSSNMSIRIHERGDFCHNNGSVDYHYLACWLAALRQFTDLPKIWTYTHKFAASLAYLGNKIPIYASVHSPNDIGEAASKGFKLFAFASEIRRKKGGNPDMPTRIEVPRLGKTLVCPEQRLGRKRVTCDKCRWCVEGKGNVVFLKH